MRQDSRRMMFVLQISICLNGNPTSVPCASRTPVDIYISFRTLAADGGEASAGHADVKCSFLYRLHRYPGLVGC